MLFAPFFISGLSLGMVLDTVRGQRGFRLVVGMTFAGCSDDEEEVQPKQTVEQIAEKIDTFMPQSLTIRTGTGSYSVVTSYRIECPFLIIEHEKDNHTYFSLNHLLKMWYVSGTLYLYFE